MPRNPRNPRNPLTPSLWSRIRNRNYRWPVTSLYRRVVPVRPHPARKLDVYTLCTGRCGTHFLHDTLRDAHNVHAVQDGATVHRDSHRAANLWIDDPDRFWNLRLEQFRYELVKVREAAKHPAEVFVDTGVAFFSFGYMAWDYFQRCLKGQRRLKLIHLVRDPVAFGRSALKAERTTGFADRPQRMVPGATAAEQAANLWNNVNRLCQQIVQRIDDPSVARTIRIEDLGVDGLMDLHEFMELRGIERSRLESMLNRPEAKKRNSHLKRIGDAVPDATDEELDLIRQMTAPLAQELGYSTAGKHVSSTADKHASLSGTAPLQAN